MLVTEVVASGVDMAIVAVVVVVAVVAGVECIFLFQNKGEEMNMIVLSTFYDIYVIFLKKIFINNAHMPIRFNSSRIYARLANLYISTGRWTFLNIFGDEN